MTEHHVMVGRLDQVQIWYCRPKLVRRDSARSCTGGIGISYQRYDLGTGPNRYATGIAGVLANGIMLLVNMEGYAMRREGIHDVLNRLGRRVVVVITGDGVVV